MLLFFNIRPAMFSKHSELAKRQDRDHYRRLTSPSSCTAPPTSHQEVGSSSRRHTTPPPSRMQEVGSSSRRHTTPPPSRQEEASSDNSVEMWVVAPTPPHLVAPPPPTHLVAPPLTHLEETSSNDSSSTSLGYNDECPHVKDVSSYELLLDFNCLV
jgi:hypothetical protein